jgi:predicted glycogen debranching enzyme
MYIELGRDVCGDLPAASAREWLVHNGIGGFAAGTVSGVLSRRYHGLLIAALSPPLGRTLLVSHLDETVTLAGETYPLGCSRWASGAITGGGQRFLERFTLEGQVPAWTYAPGDALLEKRIYMAPERNTTYVQYTLRRGSASGRPLSLRVKALVNYRDYHGETHTGDWRMRVERGPSSSVLHIVAHRSARPFSLRLAGATLTPEHSWYHDYLLSHEQERGFPGHEDHLCIGEFEIALLPGESACFIASCEPEERIDPDHATVLATVRERQRALLQQAGVRDDSSALSQLVLAADAFVVQRQIPLVSKTQPGADPHASEPGHSIIAGYPWFSDWGRDSMISLPGLLLATGRPRIARSLLRTYARFVDEGLIPNRFPDADSTPEYNTADATLWLLEALRAYVEATADLTLVEELWPTLRDIVRCHLRGTRHGIRCDRQDGLLYAGEAGVQLTWMDAKVGDWVVTPRIGKPIEINALWYSGLCALADLATATGQSLDAAYYREHAEAAADGFARFYIPERGFCFDVLDGPDGNDASLRPNQIFAVSLPYSALSPDQRRAVVDACAVSLYTSRGLRSLAASDPAYIGRYTGNVRSRDGAYHQGTVWGFLLGPFALAHYRVYGDAARAQGFLLPMLDHLREAGLGQFSEIFDGAPPHMPRGCIAQAWSVAEWLRAFRVLASPAQWQPAQPSEQNQT